MRRIFWAPLVVLATLNSAWAETKAERKVRILAPTTDFSKAEQFELYQLLDRDESKGLELEVWSDGDTDVFLTMYRPLSDIVDMYPGS